MGLLAVALLATSIALVAWGTGLLRTLEFHSVDQRFEIRGQQPVPDDLAIVDIDAHTFSDLDEQWPFPRSLHGRVIDQLRRDGAAAVAYDVQFTEPTIPREDNALIRAVGRKGGVVLSTTEVDGNGNTNVFGGEDVLRRFGARAASTIVDTDPGGTIRKMPYETDGLVSIPVAIGEQSKGEISRTAFTEDGSAWIDYRGPPGTIETVSFSKVMNGDFRPGTFRGKTVVVGSSAPSLQDRHPVSTSADDLMSGPEVQANAIWTVAHGFPLRSSSDLIDLALIVLLSVATPALMFRFAPLPAMGLAIAAATLFALLAQLAFNNGTIVPVVYPLLGFTIAAVGSLAVSYLDSAFERQRVRDTFARFVPETVVSDVLERTDEDLRLGGVRRDGTVLFCDLRDFTSFAETLDPDAVIEVLNRYLTLVSDEIMDQGGTLVAYMGDGVMAVFGAPIEQPDHADRALRAARRISGTQMDEFNRWLKEQGLGEGFRIGIGINSGPVMSGQVGSERRMEYTALGDTTNTASRIEAMTKDMSRQVLFSEATRRALLEEPPDIEPLGDQEVRGRSNMVRLWGIPDRQEGRTETRG